MIPSGRNRDVIVGKLSHIDENNRPNMVDVSGKAATLREAHARSVVNLPEAVLAALEGDEIKAGPIDGARKRHRGQVRGK